MYHGLRWAGGRGAAVFAVAALAFLGFFRDPERTPPDAAGGGAGPRRRPRDGGRPRRWIRGSGPAVRVSIFLSPLDVHVNRAPVGGLVKNVEYAPGRFLAAYRPEASEENERCTVSLEGRPRARGGEADRGGAGPAHRVPGAAGRQRSRAGERYGLIRFGSRTDLVRAARHRDPGAGGGPGARGGVGDGGAAMRRTTHGRGGARAPAAEVAGAAPAAAARDLPAAEPAHHRQPVLRVPGRWSWPRSQRFTEAAISHLRGDGHGHAGRQGGAAHQDHHPVRRRVRLARRRGLLRGGARLHALLVRAGAAGARGLARRVPLRDLRRPAPRPLQRLRGRDRPALLRRAADPGRGRHRGLGGAAPGRRRDPALARGG